MTPEFAQAVDPIFLHVLDLLDRIERGETPAFLDERIRIRALIDEAEAKLGGGPEWTSTKYALASWIDELLSADPDYPWAGQEWWNNNSLEFELFKSKERAEQFYERAARAPAPAREIYYICVMLGFRGLYRNVDSHYVESQGLPADLSEWARQMRLSIGNALGQGRAPLPKASPGRPAGAQPLSGKPLLVWSSLAGIILTVCNVLVAYYHSGVRWFLP